MTLDEIFDADEAVMVTKKQAHREVVLKHGVEWSEFVSRFGERDEYDAADILRWLGH